MAALFSPQLAAQAAPLTAQPALSLQGVSKVFGDGDGQVTALHPVDFEVQPGELVAVVGPSGSGKSTLLTLAGALQTPTSGTVRVAGRDISTLSGAELADFRLRQIGFVLQASNLLPYLTVREQLTLMPTLAGRTGGGAQADQLLASLGLAERAHFYPQHLSGGQKQRVAIARALMNDPALILADEPTAALDGARGREVVSLLAHQVQSRGKAAVMITHDERVLDLCTRVVRLEDGRLLSGPGVTGH
ncbi:ABC transporter ATP-binding protein [Deinococcus lacus]|uniref:Putative hemin import ATP-binding protein HrtA n=1 Tax=Deinococcus lacus TaxID=392561 RepID=A0ABW1YBT4_9DEIO